MGPQNGANFETKQEPVSKSTKIVAWNLNASVPERRHLNGSSEVGLAWNLNIFYLMAQAPHAASPLYLVIRI